MIIRPASIPTEGGTPTVVGIDTGGRFSSMPFAEIEGPFWVVNTPEPESQKTHLSPFGKKVFATVLIMVISHEINRWAKTK